MPKIPYTAQRKANMFHHRRHIESITLIAYVDVLALQVLALDVLRVSKVPESFLPKELSAGPAPERVLRGLCVWCVGVLRHVFH